MRWAATEALKKIGGKATCSSLQIVLCDKSFGVRLAAAKVLEEIGGEAFAGTLQAALGDECGAESIIPLSSLRLSFSDLQATESFRAHQAAAEARGKIGDAAVISALQATLHDDNVVRRWIAIGELGKIGDAQLFSKLINDFRRCAQTETAVYSVIKAMQQRCKIYRADAF